MSDEKENADKRTKRVSRFRAHIERHKLKPDQIRLMAYLGYQPAIDYTEDSVVRPAEVKEYIRGFTTYGQTCSVRAAIALARECMRQYEATTIEDVPEPLRTMPRELVIMAESRLDTLAYNFSEAAIKLAHNAAEEPMVLAEQDGLLHHAGWLSICHYALLITGPKWEQALHEMACDVEISWKDDLTRPGVLIAGELRPWVMGIEDPVKNNPTKPS